MLAYNIWQDKHYNNLNSLLDRLESLDINTVFVVNGIRLQHPDILKGFKHKVPPPVIWNTIHTAKKRGFNVWLKPHIHSIDAYGNQPDWWQGFVGLNFSKTDKDHFFNFLYPQECLEPVFHCQNKLDGLVLGTELASLVSAPEWNTYVRVLRDNIETYQSKNFKITYAHNSWQPILYNRYGLIRAVKFWLGTEGIIDRVLSEQPRWNITDEYKKPLGEAIYKSKGKVSCFNELDYIGLDCYPYWTFNPSYSRQKIEKLLTDYEYTTKLWFWTLRYKIDYLTSINNWLTISDFNRKDLIITECSTMGNPEVRDDLDFQIRWWSSILKAFNYARLIGIWDDGLALDAIGKAGINS